ncbi:DUF6265 family protein [Flagellimonas marina]|uniref:DUF6265 family protein n=1 Tax=Flagellimonas marina TaxID=1775168 RepID=A0ABV8PMW6_9FLAO
MKKLLFLLFFPVGIMSAQETLQLSEGQNSPSASLEDVAWIAGHWQGEAFGGMAEEIWSNPMGGSMMFVFRLVADNEVSFYEVGHIQEVDDSIILQLKHFDKNLRGWEEKNETVDFRLVKIERNKAYFEGFTIEKVSEDQINMWVLIESKDSAKEVLFAYKRM